MYQANELIEKWAGDRPDKVYLYYADREISYKQLFDRVNSVAAFLKSLGIQKGDRVGLFLRNCPEFLYSWFGLNKIGAVMVPINTGLKRDETAYILSNSGCRGVIAESENIETVIIPAVEKSPSVEWIAGKGELAKEGILPFGRFLEDKTYLETVRWPEDDMAAILYTSGTTGAPKGVMCPHRYYSNIGQTFGQWLNLTPEDRMLTLLPLFHMNAQTTSTIGSLSLGASLVLLEGFHPDTFWKDVCRYGATVFNYLGSILPILIKLPVNLEEKNHRVRLGVGAQADPNLIETYEKRWGLSIIELYGMTEIGGTCNPIEGKRFGSCGVPFAGNEIRIVDDQGQVLPTGETGEIIVRGPSMTLGYWQNPEETAKTYREGWVFTGDMGYQDQDGFLYFVARKKDIIRRSGENISAVEVENVVMGHPKIVEAAALPVPDPIRDEEVKIYVVLQDGETPETVSPEEIVRWCQERMAKFKVPRYIEYRDSIPKTETQKVHKALLRKEKPDLTAGAWDRFAEKRN